MRGDTAAAGSKPGAFLTCACDCTCAPCSAALLWAQLMTPCACGGTCHLAMGSSSSRKNSRGRSSQRANAQPCRQRRWLGTSRERHSCCCPQRCWPTPCACSCSTWAGSMQMCRTGPSRPSRQGPPLERHRAACQLLSQHLCSSAGAVPAWPALPCASCMSRPAPAAHPPAELALHTDPARPRLPCCRCPCSAARMMGRCACAPMRCTCWQGCRPC